MLVPWNQIKEEDDMRKILSKILGVTLLEVLLVLVIASLVLVMSIRYYQTASTQAKVNAGMETLSGLMAGVDAYLASGNSIGGVAAGVLPYLPNGAFPANPFGVGTVEVVSASPNYTVTFQSVPSVACTMFRQIAKQNQKVDAPACSGSAGNLVFTITP
jgi:Tfp pilus assembly protein PilE